MFIRVVKKQNSKEGKVFYQFMLAQNSRINGKVKQSNILSLGSDIELLNNDIKNEVLVLLKAKIFNQELAFPVQNKTSIDLATKYFEKFQIKFAQNTDYSEVVSSPPKHDGSDYQEIDVASIDVVASKSFGAENICNLMYEKLGFEQIFKDLKWSESDIKMAQLSILSRTIFSASEHKTAQILRDNSALTSIIDYNKSFTHRDLYPILDKLHAFQMQIDKKLYSNINTLFDIDQSIVIYDLSNLYFEGRKATSEIAQFGRSKEKRYDCKQVVFTGIIDSKGFIKHSKIYQGNMSDSKTIALLLADFETQGVAIKDVTIVMDAGFATEDNLELITSKQMKYVAVARNKIKNYEINPEKELIQVFDNKGNSIDLQVFKSEKHADNWMYVKSEQKRMKENSMAEKLEKLYLEELQNLNDGLSKKRTIKNALKISERLGRIKQKHKLVSSRYQVDIQVNDHVATSINWSKIEPKENQTKQEGVYFIRTNYQDVQENKLWEIYNIIREVEATFRCLKSDLLIRPVYHKTDIKVKGHIYQTILSYQIVNAIRYYLKEAGVNYDWQNIVRILNTQCLVQVKLPTKTKNLTIEKPSKPIEEVQMIYDCLKFKIIRKTKKVHVVYH
ncbi:IS1634 family transposase [Flavobacterium branchiophilum]|uniref:Transposase n=1 Tax=Flavobacterium branchiophilum TaxID=55197 RepID=A0A543G1R8_9FLAO|nr:IS1634 family transposase [Flavobacterium branchiophilum]TQM40018.1 transposase [Flavobacterium branchiophilum]TQM40354.1 transposase [Flavobacterium branchiophilum]